MAYNVYSLPDCRTVLYHPDVGTANLHQCGVRVNLLRSFYQETISSRGFIAPTDLRSR